MTSEFFQRHKAGMLLLAFVLFSLTCLTNRVDPTVAGFKTVIWYLVSPEVVYSGQFFNRLDALSGRIFKLARAEGENHILREQNVSLAKREIERDALERENNRLRVLLNLKERFYPQAIPAEVMGHDVRDWFYSVIIDKGEKDGVELSAAVVSGTANGPSLVGRVTEMDDHTSKVLLITDPVSAVSVAIESTGDLGLLEGQNQPNLVVKYLSNRSNVKVGDSVSTVGLGGVFPPGVPIGQVTRVYETLDGFFKEAVVQPVLDFGSLQELLVLKREEIKVVAAEQ